MNAIAKQMPLLEIKTAIGNKLIQTAEILYIKANNKHSIIYFTDGEFIEVNLPLKFYDGKLSELFFYRCHDSYIVNCLQVNCTCASDLIFHGKTRIPVSRSKKQALKENLENLHKAIVDFL